VTVTARRLVVVAALGVAVFAGLSISSDLGALGDRLAGFKWPTFAAALALASCNYGLRFVRWQLYLRRRRIQVATRTSALVFLSGFALSITPGKLGELIKSYLLRHTDGVAISRSAPIVLAERVTDLIALLILGLVGVMAYGMAAGMVLAGFAAVVAGLVVLAWPALAHRVIDLVTRPRRLARFRARLLDLYDNLIALLRPAPLAWASALATVAWLAECIGFALIVGGFSGTDVSLGLAILIYATTTVAGALSFLPGGLLVTEAGMTLLLVEASRGVDQPTAAAATILTRLATLWFAVAIGVVALAVLRRHTPATAGALDDASRAPGA
jgi:glycosyltransferase 2 family protein